MKSSLNIHHDALFPLSWFFTMVTLRNVRVHVQANPLFQVAQPASSLKYFETHLRKERHRLPTMKLLLYLALFADLDPYQSVHHHHTGRPCSPREVQLEKSHYLQSAKLIECLGMQEVSCLTASRLVVLTRMSNVALHCLPVTAPPSVLQLISGFFFCAVTASARVKRRELSLWHSGIISNTSFQGVYFSSWTPVEQVCIIDNQKAH